MYATCTADRLYVLLMYCTTSETDSSSDGFLFASAADEKRRRRKKGAAPSIPAQLADGCPYHKHTTTVSSDELSEFGHELERDGRKPEAERCYARAIRSSPQAATGWFDLAAAHQYSDQSAAIRYYRHGLKLHPSGAAPTSLAPSCQPLVPCSTPARAFNSSAGFQYNQLGDEAVLRSLTELFDPEHVQLLYQIGLIGKRDLPLSPSPQIGFEMVMLRMLAFQPEVGPTDEHRVPADRGDAGDALGQPSHTPLGATDSRP